MGVSVSLLEEEKENNTEMKWSFSQAFLKLPHTLTRQALESGVSGDPMVARCDQGTHQ